MNFPNADTIISSTISTLLSNHNNKDDASLDVGGFLGYQFEKKIHCAFTETKQFPIMLDKASVVVNVSFCSTASVEATLDNGVVYKLYSSHPAVDIFHLKNQIYRHL